MINDNETRGRLVRAITSALIASAVVVSASALADHHRADEKQGETADAGKSAMEKAQEEKQAAEKAVRRQDGGGGSMERMSQEDAEETAGDMRDRAEVTGSVATEYPTTATPKYEDAIERAGRSKLPAMRASRILGKDVRGAQGEVIGQVKDLVIGGDMGEMKAVISVGGFLGIGDKLVAVPYSRLTQAPDHEGDLLLDESRDALKDMKAFKFEQRRGSSDDASSASDGDAS